MVVMNVKPVIIGKNNHEFTKISISYKNKLFDFLSIFKSSLRVFYF